MRPCWQTRLRIPAGLGRCRPCAERTSLQRRHGRLGATVAFAAGTAAQPARKQPCGRAPPPRPPRPCRAACPCAFPAVPLRKSRALGRGRSGRLAEAGTASGGRAAGPGPPCQPADWMAGGVRMRVARRPTARMPPCRPCARPAAACRPSQLQRPAWRSKRARPVPQAAARIGGARLRLRAEAPAAVGRRLRVGIDYKMRAHSRPVDAGRVGRRLRVGIDYKRRPVPAA